MKKIIKYIAPLCIFFSFISFSYAQEKKNISMSLSVEQIDEIILYGNFTGSSYVGKIFNKIPNIVITQITIEAVPQDEENIFNKYSPRFFNVNLNVMPRIMSSEFKIDTGALNPEFHTAKISEAKGYEEK